MRVRSGGLVLCVVLGLAACRPPAPQRPALPPPRVIVAPPSRAEIAETAEFTGRMAAVASVEVRARVTGRLEAMSFRPRDLVKEGQRLFRIEPDLYQALVDESRGQVKQAEVQLAEAAETVKRMEAALATNAVSELEVIARRAARDAASARLLSAKAALRRAEIDLGYSQVTAPVEGRISRNFVDVGNLVGYGQQTLLAYIVQDREVFVYFNVDERTHLAYLRRHKDSINDPNRPRPKIQVKLTDESEFSRQGEVEYGAPRIDATTGTVEIRARLKNTDGLLSDGLFCRVQVPLGPPETRLFVPIRAIRQDVGGHYLLVVKDDKTVAYRAVKLGMTRGGEREIVEGIGPRDQVIIDGVQKARPGAPVDPRPAEEKPAGKAEAAGGQGS